MANLLKVFVLPSCGLIAIVALLFIFFGYEWTLWHGLIVGAYIVIWAVKSEH